MAHHDIGSVVLDRQIFNYIDGEYRQGSDGRTFPNFDPATGEQIGEVYEASRDDVDAAVRAAKAALTGPWGRMSIPERVKLIGHVADEIERRFMDFLAAEVADTGKPVEMASHIDIPRGAANFRMFADVISTIPTEAFEMTTPDGGRALNYSVRKPKGVIAVISPWNLPLLLMTWKVGPALACGNTVVVKPSEETPRTAALLGEVMTAVGVPPGVFNVVHGFGPNSAGEFLTQHPDVDGITFTGETRTGEAIMRQAAVGVRQVSFELGGKNPAVIFADCDLDKAVNEIARAAFLNTGQVCLGTERVYVERPIFDKFVSRLAEASREYALGGSKQMGPLISDEHRQKVLAYYELAKQEGGQVVTGGGIPEGVNGGFWIEPTVWTGIPHGARVTKEEVFGPCCAVIPFDTEEEGIEMGNDTPYGLCATIWTQDVSRAHRVAAAMNVGICWINSWFLRDLRTAFGGAAHSGIGREGGVHSLEFYTETENVCLKL